MNSAFLSEFASIPWAMEPAALEAFLTRVSAFPVLPQFSAAVSGPGTAAWKSRMKLSEDGTATVLISGVLLKTVPAWLRFYGVDATGYDEIAADIDLALADPSLKSINLKVSSPGGQVAGVKEAADAIYAARARTLLSAEIEDIGASGAYWLASQAGRISAGKNALVGSIGVYTAYLDLSRMAENVGIKVHVIASGPHKGMGVPGAPITAEQLAAMQEVINGMAENFVADVARGLEVKVEDVEKWATGRVWLADEAAAQGLIQAVTSFPTTKAAAAHVGTAASIEAPFQERVMADTKVPAAAAQDALASTPRKPASPGELKAAFPKDPEFALSQLEAGATLLEAKAAYAEVLQGRLDASSRENAELKKKPAAEPRGAEPLPSEGEPGATSQDQQDFMARAEQLALERKWTKTQAMSHLARTEPELFERHCQAAIDNGKSSKVDRKFQRVAR